MRNRVTGKIFVGFNDGVNLTEIERIVRGRRSLGDAANARR
jgi:hypothetical protein